MASAAPPSRETVQTALGSLHLMQKTVELRQGQLWGENKEPLKWNSEQNKKMTKY